jgi:glycosyltransferase involved in cell wall biosynthesis
MNRILRILASFVASPLVVLLLAWECLAVLFGRRRRAEGEVLLSLSEVMWDEVWQRPQEFAWRVSRQVPVVYCSPVQVHRWLFTLRGRYRPVQVFADGRQLTVLSPLVFSGHYKSAFIHALNSVVLAAWARLHTRRASGVCCVVNTPFVEQVVALLYFLGDRRDIRLRRLSFDFIDDFAAFEWAPRSARASEARLESRCDAVFTGTHELLEARRASRPDAEFIPCGVDFELFNDDSAPEPTDIAPLRRPIIGYFGSISERIDMDLIAELARAFPDASLALVGPVHLSPEQTARGPNIHYLGLKAHPALPAYARRFDAGLIPFRITAATLKLNPVKTLEYLAAGVAVVSTAIPDVERFFGDVVRVAHSPAEFVAAVRDALAAPDAAAHARGLALARAASWDAMTKRMAELVLGRENGPGGKA